MRAAFAALVVVVVVADDLESSLLLDPSSLNCASAQYFNSVEQSCRNCSSIGASELVASEDGTCRCPVGYRLDDNSPNCADDGTCFGLGCTSCTSLGYDTSYSDNSGCAMCEGEVDASTGDCLCGDDIIVEKSLGGADYLLTKYCAVCAAGRFVVKRSQRIAGRFYKADPYLCQTCPDPLMTWNSVACECPDGYVEAGVEDVGPLSCVLEADVIDDFDEPYAVEFRSVQETRGGKTTKVVISQSQVMEHYLTNATSVCANAAADGSRRETSCQALANLCVLTNYDLRSPACVEYQQLYSEEENRPHMPRLIYEDDGDSVRDDAGIEMKMTFSHHSQRRAHKFLRLRAAIYTLNGTLLGVDDLETQLFYGEMKTPETHKGGGETRSTVWQRFGYSFRDHFRVELERLTHEEQLFYELFVVDQGADDSLYRVPIQNRQLRNNNGREINQNEKTSDEGNDILTTRFVLYDIVTGISSSSSTTGTEGGTPSAPIRFLTKIVLHCESRLRKPNRLFSPYLELDYGERRANEGGPMSEGRVQLRVEYWMDAKNFWKVADALFFTWLALTLVAWVYSLRIWQAKRYAKRQQHSVGGMVVSGETAISLSYAWHCLVLYARVFVELYFPLVLLFCTYWFVFFKLQDTVFIMLARENREDGREYEYYPIRTMIIVMWVAQTASVLQLVYDQCAHEIFFLDWETPRKDNFVSVWRTMFIANEWNQLQTARRTSLHVILFGLALVLVGFDLESDAEPRPDLEEKSFEGSGVHHHNIALRFANTTWWFLIFAFVQYLWRNCVYERYFAEPKAQSFLDVCTVAKISVLIFDSDYHGFYLHADSPYPYADETMSELTRHLFNESNSEAIGRGLDHRLPELQTFRMWLTPHFRQSWDEVHRECTSGVQQKHRSLQTPPSIFFRESRTAFFTGATAETTRASQLLNSFLRTFLLHGYKDDFKLDWVIRLPNVFERLTGQPPPLAQLGGDVVFEPDAGGYTFYGDQGWTEVTFLGNDATLLIHEILTFGVCDIWFGSTSLSILLTFLLHHAIRLVRSVYGEHNLSERALIDRRFLK